MLLHAVFTQKQSLRAAVATQMLQKLPSDDRRVTVVSDGDHTLHLSIQMQQIVYDQPSSSCWSLHLNVT